MRKKVTMFICAAMATAMVSLGGCGFHVNFNSNQSQQYGDIKKAYTTSWDNGKSEEKVTYTNVKTGEVLDQKTGEQEFEAAKAAANA